MSSENCNDDGTAIHATLNSWTNSADVVHPMLASLVEPVLGDAELYHDQEDYTQLLQDHTMAHPLLQAWQNAQIRYLNSRVTATETFGNLRTL